MTLEAAYHLAMVHRQAGRLVESEALLRQIVAAKPDHGAAWHQLGLVVLTAGRSGEAVEYLARAITLHPGLANYHSDQGVAYWLMGKAEESIDCFQRALELAPDLPQTHRNLGDVYFGSNKFDQAAACYQRALAIAPNEAGTHNNLGNVFLHHSQLTEAAACYRRAAELDPQLLQAQINLGGVLTRLGRTDESLVCAQRVVALNPNFPEGHLNMGAALWHEDRFAEVEACFRRAIACRADFPDAHLNLGLLLLLLGRYEEGWREYEWRLRSPQHTSRLRGFSAPQWNGSPVPGKTILIHAEQGLGDTLQFLRYLPLVQERSQAEKVIFECQPQLLSLLRPWVDARIAMVGRSDTAETLPPFDLHIPLIGLPPALQYFVPFPMSAPYVQADSDLRAGWHARLNPDVKLRVGLAWAGNPDHPDDLRRSIPPEALLPLLRLPGVSFVSLQVEPRGSLPPALAATGLLDFTENITDFAATAALVTELDLVVTVDTATAHLAGALGRPVWVMLPFTPDWRWGLKRADTPWYPTMRLFRQAKAGDWGDVVARVEAALRDWPVR